MDEEERLAALKRGDEAALEWFIDRYAAYVGTIIHNIIGGAMSAADMEEAAADVFVTLWKNALRVRPGKVKAYLSGAGDVGYQLYCHAKGSFTRGWALLADIGGFEEWAYTAEDGTELLLALGEYKSLIAADVGNSFVFINVLSGTDNSGRQNDGAQAAYGSPTLDKASLEALADSFGFAAMNELGGK